MHKDICMAYWHDIEQAKGVNDFMVAKRNFIGAVMLRAGYSVTYTDKLCYAYWPIFGQDVIDRLTEWDKENTFEQSRGTLLTRLDCGNVNVLGSETCPFCEIIDRYYRHECYRCLYGAIVEDSCSKSYYDLDDILSYIQKGCVVDGN
jgi:hypothetical protein